LPLDKISDIVVEENRKRDFSNRLIWTIDACHGLGNQDINLSKIACDFFVSGTHKWLFGPRGTGILFGRKSAWNQIVPTVPSFSKECYRTWRGQDMSSEITFAHALSPGGFHSYELWWSLPEAFEFMESIGKLNIQKRTEELNTMLKLGISDISDVKLITPIDTSLSAGINCIEIGNLTSDELVEKLLQKNIVSSSGPYRKSYARLTPCILNTEDEVISTLDALKEICYEI
jgi:selenocysteine lyase/cysteine desulfurase